MRPEDWPQVEAIYREGIDAGNATFESDPPTWEAFDAGKVADVRLVATDENGAVIGWAAASPVSSRDVYRGVIEHSVYVAAAAKGEASDVTCFWRSSKRLTPPGTGWCSRASSPRTSPAWRSTRSAGFREVGRRRRDRTTDLRALRRDLARHGPCGVAQRAERAPVADLEVS